MGPRGIEPLSQGFSIPAIAVSLISSGCSFLFSEVSLFLKEKVFRSLAFYPLNYGPENKRKNKNLKLLIV